jgi:hypothetical protein
MMQRQAVLELRKIKDPAHSLTNRRRRRKGEFDDVRLVPADQKIRRSLFGGLSRARLRISWHIGRFRIVARRHRCCGAESEMFDGDADNQR